MILSRLQFLKTLLCAPLAARAALAAAPVLRGRPPCPACGGTTVSTSSTTGCCDYARRRAGFTPLIRPNETVLSRHVVDRMMRVNHLNWINDTPRDFTHYRLYGLAPGQSYDVAVRALSS